MLEVATADRDGMWWYTCVPPSDILPKEVNLLTIGGRAVRGLWTGEVGDLYIAWCPFLKFNDSTTRADYPV